MAASDGGCSVCPAFAHIFLTPYLQKAPRKGLSDGSALPEPQTNVIIGELAGKPLDELSKLFTDKNFGARLCLSSRKASETVACADLR
jgi:hypothetical protein